jgi:hypothetical protein
VDPFERGFFCNDETLSLPLKKNTVPMLVQFGAFTLTASLIVSFILGLIKDSSVNYVALFTFAKNFTIQKVMRALK